MTRDIIKCAFFHSEEMGCVGSRQADMDWFKDVGYCFQADRQGSSDFINNISGKLFSKAFTKKISPVLSHHGYKITSGAITDVGQLAENGIGVCVANMSCGYYAPHSDEEVVIFDDANNCLTMVDRLIDELGCNKYEYQYTSSYGNYDFNFSEGGKWGDWNGANRNYWYGDYGTANREVKINDETGEFECYYCGCSELLESDIGDEYAYCPDCISDIYCGEPKEEIDPNQIEMFEDDEDMKHWNKSFGVENDEYEDISDNYDGSMKHRSLVNKYLTDHWSKKNK
jgi:hypothetical protein